MSRVFPNGSRGGILDSRFRGNDELYPLDWEKTQKNKPDQPDGPDKPGLPLTCGPSKCSRANIIFQQPSSAIEG